MCSRAIERPGQFLNLIQRCAVRQREALQDAAGELAGSFRCGLASLTAVRRDGIRHVARFRESRCIGVDQRAEWLQPFPLLRSGSRSPNQIPV